MSARIRRAGGLPGDRADGDRAEQVERFDPVPAGNDGAVFGQGVGGVGGGQRRQPDQQQRPGSSRAPAGQGDHADDQGQHADVAERIGEGRRPFEQGAAGPLGDELEDRRGAERGGAERGDQSVGPEPPVEHAPVGADQLQQAGRGERVVDEVGGVGGGGDRYRGVALERRGPVDLAGPPGEHRGADQDPGGALAALGVGLQQRRQAGGDDHRVVQRPVDRVVEAGAADLHPIVERDEQRAAEKDEGDQPR